MDANVYKAMLGGFDEVEMEVFDSKGKLISKQTINQESLEKVHRSWFSIVSPENDRSLICEVIDDIIQKAQNATN